MSSPVAEGVDATMRTCQFGPLAHGLRRRVMTVLRNVDGPIALADLARDLARQESGDEFAGAQQILINLYHWHLPKLADHGLVEFDTHRNTVALADATTVDEE